MIDTKIFEICCKFYAILILLFYFLVLPDLIKKYIWPREIKNEKLFLFLFSIIVHEGIYIICNLFYFVIYKIEHPFFEKYKINKEPWPWNQNKDHWYKLLGRSLKIILFNQFVIAPMVSFLSI